MLVLNWFLFIYAVNHVSLQSASFAYIICPILTTVLAFILLKERIDVWQWIAVGLCVISCLILSYGNFKDLIYSVIIALSFGFYLVSQRKNSDFDKFLILTVQMVISSAILLPFTGKISFVGTRQIESEQDCNIISILSLWENAL